MLAEALWTSPAREGLVKVQRLHSKEEERTLKLVLGSLGVAAGIVEVVADTTGGTEAEDQGHSRLGHDDGVVDVRATRGLRSAKGVYLNWGCDGIGMGTGV